jgi:hypothetical protein
MDVGQVLLRQRAAFNFANTRYIIIIIIIII